MKILKILSAFAFSLFFVQLQAQNDLPKGFRKGNIVLPDNTIINGFVKDNIRGNASVVFLTEEGKKKKEYDGNGLLSVTIDSSRFICIKGDFFRVLCEGEWNFLQKASDASGKPTYNGSEAVFSNGTDGKPGDYFTYNTESRQLKLVTKKNLDAIIAASFANCASAIDKIRSAKKDSTQLKEAVAISNTRTNN